VKLKSGFQDQVQLELLRNHDPEPSGLFIAPNDLNIYWPLITKQKMAPITRSFVVTKDPLNHLFHLSYEDSA